MQSEGEGDGSTFVEEHLPEIRAGSEDRRVGEVRRDRRHAVLAHHLDPVQPLA